MRIKYKYWGFASSAWITESKNKIQFDENRNFYYKLTYKSTHSYSLYDVFIKKDDEFFKVCHGVCEHHLTQLEKINIENIKTNNISELLQYYILSYFIDFLTGDLT